MISGSMLRPVLDGDFWLIGPNPRLPTVSGDLQGDAGPIGKPGQECVDHHVFQSPDGSWHLWGCIRKTAVGRILYHWEGQSLTDGPWQGTGEIIRVDRDAGESLDDWEGEEWIQSPFIVQESGLYYMFYGGHGTGTDGTGRSVDYKDPRMACQMCLMSSTNGRNWTRHKGEGNRSRVFIGPGQVRDPCLIKINGLWHMYYAGYHSDDNNQAGVFVRTSMDMLQWSDWTLVHQDTRFGDGPVDTECPFVAFRNGLYYLFRTEDYASAKTHVFVSEDPMDFGIGDAGGKYLGLIDVAAPEIIVHHDGSEFITSNHDLQAGTQMCRLQWLS